MKNTNPDQFSAELISLLQQIRRANEGITACSQILAEDIHNQAGRPVNSREYLRINKQQVHGLLYAIDACCSNINDAFENNLEDRGVGWREDWNSEIRDRELEVRIAAISS